MQLFSRSCNDLLHFLAISDGREPTIAHKIISDDTFYRLERATTLVISENDESSLCK